MAAAEFVVAEKVSWFLGDSFKYEGGVSSTRAAYLAASDHSLSTTATVKYSIVSLRSHKRMAVLPQRKVNKKCQFT